MENVLLSPRISVTAHLVRRGKKKGYAAMKKFFSALAAFLALSLITVVMSGTSSKAAEGISMVI
jgi:hypothetical protein